MLNHQKGPKQNLKKKLLFTSCSQFQAPVPKPMTSLGQRAHQVVGSSFKLTIWRIFCLSNACCRGCWWNDMEWRSDQLRCATVWRRETAPLSWSAPFFSGEHPFRWACWSAASPQPSSGIAVEIPHVRAHGLGGDVFSAYRWHLSSQKWYVVRGTLAQSMLSFLHFHPGDPEERECWYHDILVHPFKHLAFSCLHNDDQNLGLGPNKDPLKNRLKAVAAIGVRNPIRTHFPKNTVDGRNPAPLGMYKTWNNGINYL